MKNEDKNIRKITRAGKTSLGVTLPIDMLRELDWKEKQQSSRQTHPRRHLPPRLARKVDNCSERFSHAQYI